MKIGFGITVVSGVAAGLIGVAHPIAGVLIGGLGTIVGSRRQKREDGPWERKFAATDWQPYGAEYEIEVSAKTHGKGPRARPSVDMLDLNTHTYSACDCEQRVAPSGNVTIRAVRKFEGRLIII